MWKHCKRKEENELIKHQIVYFKQLLHSSQEQASFSLIKGRKTKKKQKAFNNYHERGGKASPLSTIKIQKGCPFVICKLSRKTSEKKSFTNSKREKVDERWIIDNLEQNKKGWRVRVQVPS